MRKNILSSLRKEAPSDHFIRQLMDYRKKERHIFSTTTWKTHVILAPFDQKIYGELYCGSSQEEIILKLWENTLPGIWQQPPTSSKPHYLHNYFIDHLKIWISRKRNKYRIRMMAWVRKNKSLKVFFELLKENVTLPYY